MCWVGHQECNVDSLTIQCAFFLSISRVQALDWKNRHALFPSQCWSIGYWSMCIAVLGIASLFSVFACVIVCTSTIDQRHNFKFWAPCRKQLEGPSSGKILSKVRPICCFTAFFQQYIMWYDCSQPGFKAGAFHFFVFLPSPMAAIRPNQIKLAVSSLT